MKARRVPFLVLLLIGFSPATLNAQTPAPFEKFVFVKSIGSSPPPTTTSTQFSAPVGVAIGTSLVRGYFERTFYVADPANNQIVVFGCVYDASSSKCVYDTATNTLSTLSCPICTWLAPLFTWTLKQPMFVASTPNANGNIWISDTGNDVVVEVNPNTSEVVAFAGVGPFQATTVCTSGNTVFVNDYDPTCTWRGHINEGQGPGQFFGPGALAVDKLGNLYVADGVGNAFINGSGGPAANTRIQKFKSDGTFLTTIGSAGIGIGQFTTIAGLAVDNSLNLYVADPGNFQVQKFDSSGALGVVFGPDRCPPPTTTPTAFGPGGIAVDPIDQSVYIVDFGDSCIEQFDSRNNFLSMGGSNGAFEAQFNGPWGIATEPPNYAQNCQSQGLSDCVHGLVVSELPVPSVALTGSIPGNLRVQLLAARPDTDNDGITDEIDTNPNTFSNDFSNASLGFTTTGTILSRGGPTGQTFVIYNLLTPTPQDLARLGSSNCNSKGCDEIRIRTETFGGPSIGAVAMFCTMKKPAIFTFTAGTGVNIHCSTPTVFTEKGPVGFEVEGRHGAVVTATLNTGDSLSFDPQSSTVICNAGTILLVVSGKTISLGPGQSFLVDMAPPTTTARSNPGASSLGSLEVTKANVTPRGALRPINCWSTDSVIVTLRAADKPGGPGVKSIDYSLSGAQSHNGVIVGNQGSITITATGQTTLKYFATDKAGNPEEPKFLGIFHAGPRLPIACIAEPKPITSPTHGTVTVSGTLTTNGRRIPFNNLTFKF
jgi:hypothetical protein